MYLKSLFIHQMILLFLNYVNHINIQLCENKQYVQLI